MSKQPGLDGRPPRDSNGPDPDEEQMIAMNKQAAPFIPDDVWRMCRQISAASTIRR
jgi:hypothetical protein